MSKKTVNYNSNEIKRCFILDGSMGEKKTVLLDVELQPQVNRSRPEVLSPQPLQGLGEKKCAILKKYFSFP